MNVFGAFNFGRLIKTFLPGFLVTVGLFFLLELYMGTTEKGKLLELLQQGTSAAR
jgi:hypothetical protein